MMAMFSCEGRCLPSKFFRIRQKSLATVIPPIKTSSKNKQGERGSAADEIADPKRVNMVSADFEPAEAVEWEDD